MKCPLNNQSDHTFVLVKSKLQNLIRIIKAFALRVPYNKWFKSAVQAWVYKKNWTYSQSSAGTRYLPQRETRDDFPVLRVPAKDYAVPLPLRQAVSGLIAAGRSWDSFLCFSNQG